MSGEPREDASREPNGTMAAAIIRDAYRRGLLRALEILPDYFTRSEWADIGPDIVSAITREADTK